MWIDIFVQIIFEVERRAVAVRRAKRSGAMPNKIRESLDI
jgi:hypothetical protein